MPSKKRMLGPGSRYFDEDRLSHRQYYGKKNDPTKYEKEPVDTEIRNFVPDPDEVGDFEFRLDDFEEKYEKQKRRRSTRL